MGTKISAENLFSLPICVIMGLTKSLPPRGRGTALVVEGACVTLGLYQLSCYALSLSRLRRQLPPGGSLWKCSSIFRGMGIARRHLFYKCETGDKGQGRSTASLREGGGPRSGGRSLRDFELGLTSLLRTLPQSATLTAPSRREPSLALLLLIQIEFPQTL